MERIMGYWSRKVQILNRYAIVKKEQKVDLISNSTTISNVKLAVILMENNMGIENRIVFYSQRYQAT